jgi:hypothetical protein
MPDGCLWAGSPPGLYAVFKVRPLQRHVIHSLTASRLLVIQFQVASSKLETSASLSGEDRALTVTWPLTLLFFFFFRSFALALHAFNLLFLRAHLTMRSKWITLAVGWTFIAFVVTIGPLAIQKKDLGPYFGPSGFWYVASRLSPPPPLIRNEGAGSQTSTLPNGFS